MRVKRKAFYAWLEVNGIQMTDENKTYVQRFLKDYLDEHDANQREQLRNLDAKYHELLKKSRNAKMKT